MFLVALSEFDQLLFESENEVDFGFYLFLLFISVVNILNPNPE